MSKINVLNIIPDSRIVKSTDGFRFEIIFEVLEPLKEVIEWKLIYIGSSQDKRFDQELESIEIGPLQMGSMKFEFDSEGPDMSKVPEEERVGVTAILLLCTYKSQEFFRCGYYINNIYDCEELIENPPEKPLVSRLQRIIQADQPRITIFNIDWDEGEVKPLDNIQEEKDGESLSSFTPVLNDKDLIYKAESDRSQTTNLTDKEM